MNIYKAINILGEVEKPSRPISVILDEMFYEQNILELKRSNERLARTLAVVD